MQETKTKSFTICNTITTCKVYILVTSTITPTALIIISLKTNTISLKRDFPFLETCGWRH